MTPYAAVNKPNAPTGVKWFRRGVELASLAAGGYTAARLGIASVRAVLAAGAAEGAGTVAEAVAAAGGIGESSAGGAEPVFYRLITEGEPEANFLSNAAKGLTPRGPEVQNPLIHNGISVFDSLERAAAKVPIVERGGKTVLGIGELRIPGDAGIEIAKTLGPGHYTLTGTPGTISSTWWLTIIKW